jgi:hypothetical protein
VRELEHRDLVVAVADVERLVLRALGLVEHELDGVDGVVDRHDRAHRGAAVDDLHRLAVEQRAHEARPARAGTPSPSRPSM